jgi:predicted metal-dependent HD superfamily phosphohydrolase
MSLLSEPVRAELVRAYTAPDRHYHDLRHVETLLRLAQDRADLLADRDAVDAAIWFHDAIYDTRRQDNEEKSAALAIERLSGAAAQERIGRIAAMIRATAGHRLPDFADTGAARDCALFLDFDLAILGSPPAAFAAYEQAVRREYGWWRSRCGLRDGEVCWRAFWRVRRFTRPMSSAPPTRRRHGETSHRRSPRWSEAQGGRTA